MSDTTVETGVHHEQLVHPSQSRARREGHHERYVQDRTGNAAPEAPARSGVGGRHRSGHRGLARGDHVVAVPGSGRASRSGVQPQRLRPTLHPQADQDRGAARRHVPADNPCGTMRGNGPDQIPAGEVGDTLPGDCASSTAPATTSSPARPRSAPPTRTSRAWCPSRSSRRRRATRTDPGPQDVVDTSYTQTAGTVLDSQPRVISNLIVDQTASNPAAVGRRRRGP